MGIHWQCSPKRAGGSPNIRELETNLWSECFTVPAQIGAGFVAHDISRVRWRRVLNGLATEWC